MKFCEFWCLRVLHQEFSVRQYLHNGTDYAEGIHHPAEKSALAVE
jgi:hypothetical protein